jgi:hypothetical protein
MWWLWLSLLGVYFFNIGLDETSDEHTRREPNDQPYEDEENNYHYSIQVLKHVAFELTVYSGKV